MNFSCNKIFFPFKISINARISQLAGFSIKQFNLHRYITTTHNNKRLKLRYLADSELLKLTAQAPRDHETAMDAVRDRPLVYESAAVFLKLQFQTQFNHLPRGYRAAVLQTALLEHAVRYIACL
jgi:hypothetical protein